MTQQTAEQLARAEERAKRLRILIDLVAARTGKELTFADISSELDARDVNLSRARWFYIVNGHRDVEDTKLLNAICDSLGAPHGYLNMETELELADAELDHVRAMRAAKVRSYATRTLGDLSPAALDQITKVLEKEAARADRREARAD